MYDLYDTCVDSLFISTSPTQKLHKPGVFVNFEEQLKRCSRLELVQVSPFPVMRFSFLRVNWVRRISNPAKIKLRVADLSGSNGWSQGWPLPAGFQNMTPQEQFHGEDLN